MPPPQGGSAARGAGPPIQWTPPVPVGAVATSPGGPGPAPAAPSGAAPAFSPGPGTTTGAADVAATVIYCSWCGKERAVDAAAIHYCGSMERPAAFCMSCGTPLAEGAPGCANCGTPATKLSR